MADFSNVLMTADFDHTLTDTHGVIPQANVDAINRFIEQGVPLPSTQAAVCPCFSPDCRKCR